MVTGQNRLFSPSPVQLRSPTPSLVGLQRCTSPRNGTDTTERVQYLRSLSVSSLRSQNQTLASISMRDNRKRSGRNQDTSTLSVPRSSTADIYLYGSFGKGSSVRQRPNVLDRFNVVLSPEPRSPPLMTPAENGTNGTQASNAKISLPPVVPKYIKEVKSRCGITICYEPGSIRETQSYVSGWCCVNEECECVILGHELFPLDAK